MNPHRVFGLCRILPVFGFLAMLAFPGAAARAQMTDRYVTRAVFQLSVDQTADFWLNGHHLFTQPYTGLEGGPQTRMALPESLCYFQHDNTLAVRVTHANHPNMGVAYLLTLVLSDGSHQIFTSSETDQHKALSLWGSPEPYGWQEPGFDDQSWGKAFDAGPVPYAAVLPDPDGDQVSFLSAVAPSDRPKQKGETHLFRIQFSLDVLPNPHCAGPAPTATPFHFIQEGGAGPLAAATPPAIASPASAVNQARVTDSWQAPAAPPLEPAPALAPSPVPATPAQTSMSFYVSLLDGPGLYRLEVVDGSGRHLRTLLEEKRTGSEQVWVQWDGKGDQGQALPSGNYWLLYSKDGQVIRKMALSGD
ncbi:MAG TPA: hypothetical protein VMU88_03555 [bacterium]|nr:hypothetical protein [bacterium]